MSCDAVRYNAIQFNAYTSTQYNSVHALQRNTIQCMHFNAIQFNACTTIQFNAIQYTFMIPIVNIKNVMTLQLYNLCKTLQLHKQSKRHDY